MKDPRGSGPITQNELAKALGLTQATVSLALRGDPRISETRRKQIQDAAREMGYQPNPTAVNLAHFKRNSTLKPVQAALAWLNFYPDPKQLRSRGEFERYWQGATATAGKFGYHLDEFACANMAVNRLGSVLLARGINGILLPPHGGLLKEWGDKWGDFHWERFSVVRFGRSIDNPATHVVTADQVSNMMLAFEETHRRGYERIGFVAEPASKKWYLFEAGYLMAQQRVEARQRLPIFRVAEGEPVASQPALARWLKKEKPDAVITTISSTREMLKKAGCRVPEDIGVAAMSVLDGNADAGIYQNSEEIGRAAVLLLISMIHDNDCGVPALHREILLPGKWVDGSSLPGRG
jgi:DNA-binding LacI/PurR family transcriptional regulator